MSENISDLGVQRRKREADEHDDNKRWTVRDLLVDSLEEIDEGLSAPERAVLILIHHEGENEIHRTVRMANIRYSEVISAFEIEKARMMKDIIE